MHDILSGKGTIYILLTGTPNLPPRTFNNHPFIHLFIYSLSTDYLESGKGDPEVNIRGNVTIINNDDVKHYNYYSCLGKNYYCNSSFHCFLEVHSGIPTVLGASHQ